MPISFMRGNYAGLEDLARRAGEAQRREAGRLREEKTAGALGMEAVRQMGRADLEAARQENRVALEDRRAGRRQGLVMLQAAIARMPKQQQAQHQYDFIMSLDDPTMDKGFGLNDESDPQGLTRGYVRNLQKRLQRMGPDAAPVFYDDFMKTIMLQVKGDLTMQERQAEATAKAEWQTSQAARKEEMAAQDKAETSEIAAHRAQYTAFARDVDQAQAKVDKAQKEIEQYETVSASFDAKAPDTAKNAAGWTKRSIAVALQQAKDKLARLEEIRDRADTAASTSLKAWQEGIVARSKRLRKEVAPTVPAQAPPGPSTRPGVGGFPAGSQESIDAAAAQGAAMRTGAVPPEGAPATAPPREIPTLSAQHIQQAREQARVAELVPMVRASKGQGPQVEAYATLLDMASSGASVHDLEACGLYSNLHPEDKKELIRYLINAGKLRRNE